MDELAQAEGLRFQTKNNLEVSEPESQVRLVLVLPPDPGVAELASTISQTIFLAIGIPDVITTRNLSVIGAEGAHADWQGFLAGFLAALVTQDWRVGVMGTTDDQTFRQAFINGVRYFCGKCRPVHPPYHEYPRFVELPPGSTSENWGTALDLLLQKSVQTVYLTPGVSLEELSPYLVSREINFISNTVPPENLHTQWIASVFPDPFQNIPELVLELLHGKESFDLPMQLALETNPNQVSPGRQRLAEAVLTELQAGHIDTLGPP
ncbi:MAG: hypothetical protein AB1345_03970 [Chloroflexota bacterium]